MRDFREILGTLRAVRRRLLRVWGLTLASAGLAVALVLVLVAVVAAARIGPAEWLRALAAGGAAIALGAALGGFFFGPFARFRSAEDLARLVGRRRPGLASDLLSTVQLFGGPRSEGRYSAELADALARNTAAALAHVPASAVVPARPLKLAAAALGGVLLVIGLSGLLGRASLQRGLHALALAGGRLAGSELADGPLVGDLKLELAYPRHTGLAPRTLEETTGDATVPRGTKVKLTGRALRPATGVKVLVGGAGGEEVREAQLRGQTVTVELTVKESLTYRFGLLRPGARPLEEPEVRRIDAEADRAPRVEIFAPKDDLEIEGASAFEVGYDVDDDFGLGEVALVWRGADGKEGRRVLEKLSPPERHRQGAVVWDLLEAQARPGARIAYWIAAVDNDEPTPKVGQSRTLYVRLVGERERRAEHLDRVRELLEKLLAALGDRLERPPGQGGTLAEQAERDRAIAELAQQLAGDGTKSMRTALAGIATRHRALGKEEVALAARLGAGGGRELERQNGKRVAALEGDAILVDDLLGRARLEDLAALTKEALGARERLEDLLKRAASTKDPALRAEIERELVAIEDKLRRLSEQLAQLQAKREVPDEFLNAQVGKETGDALQKIREALARDDFEAASRELERLSKDLERLAQVAGDDLQGMSADRFGPEEKAMNEVASELADLEKDQKELEAETRAVMEDAKKRGRGSDKDRADRALAKLRDKADQLRKRVREVPRDSVPSYEHDRLEAALKRTSDLERALELGDFDEALDQARQARNSLAELERSVSEESQMFGRMRRGDPQKALKALGEAEPLAQELVRELEQVIPPPDQQLSPEDRKKLGQLAERQKALRDRASELGDRAQKMEKGAPAPGLSPVPEGLKGAAGHMQRAEGRLRGGMPREAAGDERMAREQLGKLSEGLREEMRPGGKKGGPDGQAGMRDEVVRIPGAQEWRSPKEFRAELMEAMKEAERAPERYRRQIKRYYEEIAR